MTMKSSENTDKNRKKENEEIIQNAANSDYKYGFVTDIDTCTLSPRGLMKM